VEGVYFKICGFFQQKNHVSLLVMSLGRNLHLKKFSHVSDNLVTDHPPPQERIQEMRPWKSDALALRFATVCWPEVK